MKDVTDIFGLSEIAIRTDRGTVLKLATLRSVAMDLDGYLQQARTGVEMDKVKMNWNAVLKAMNMNLATVDRAKILSFVEKHFEEWIRTRPLKSGAKTVVLDATFLKAAKPILHEILEHSDNRIDINSLATAYCYQTEQAPSAKNRGDVSDQIRALIAHDKEGTFEITRGGMAMVYRHKTNKGKPTKVVRPEAPVKGGDVVLERYSAKVKATGISRDRFEQLKEVYAKKGGLKMSYLKEWINTRGQVMVPDVEEEQASDE